MPNAITDAIYYLNPWHQVVKEEAEKDEFYTNYYQLKARSLVVGSATYAMAGKTIALIVSSAPIVTIVAAVVTTIALEILWVMWGNQSRLLGYEMHSKIESNDELEAIATFQKGADIFTFYMEPSWKNYIPLYSPSKGIELFVLSVFRKFDNLSHRLLPFVNRVNISKALANTWNVAFTKELLQAGAELNRNLPCCGDSLFLHSLNDLWQKSEHYKLDKFEAGIYEKICYLLIKALDLLNQKEIWSKKIEINCKKSLQAFLRMNQIFANNSRS